jgi:4-hydroxy-tetrahydrodipicolinate synthase
MAHEDVRDALRGVAAGILTPFGDSGEVDHAALAGNTRLLADRGVGTFLAAANISEYHSLSRDERVASVETAVDATPDDATVLAGVGGPTKDAADLVAAYDGVGADAMMVMPPDHTYRHERGLLDDDRALADAAESPLVPYVRGFQPSVDFLVDLASLAGVAGVKYAIEDPAKLDRATDEAPDDVVWSCGLAEPPAPAFWEAGAEGFTAGVSNFEPRLGLALYDALASGDRERAWRLRDATLPFMDFRSTTGPGNALPAANSVPVVKAALELSGFEYHGGRVREPIVELAAADRRRVAVLFEELQTALDRLLD